MMKAVMKLLGLICLSGLVSVLAKSGDAPGLSPVEELGKKLFFDAGLSTPPGQSCAACHDPKAGWTGPVSYANLPGAVYEGALKGRFGNRKPPSSAYAGDSPNLQRDENGDFAGGMFWDGRATGEVWGDPLAEQAGGPFLNPLEQNNPDKKTVVMKVKESGYAALFGRVWKVGRADWEKNVDRLYECICRSIAAYERSAEVNPFNSKFDAFWKNARARNLKVESIAEDNRKDFKGLGLDDFELKGLLVFNTNGKCSNCHVLTAGPGGEPPVFTDFGYDNLGVPRNPANPFYRMGDPWNPDGGKWVDGGLGGFLKETGKYKAYAADQMGKHKAPTLRNVALKPEKDFVKVYMHNGCFSSLKDVVHFYSARDAGGFPPPEVGDNINRTDLGMLGLTEEEENAVVAFLETLNDGYAAGKK